MGPQNRNGPGIGFMLGVFVILFGLLFHGGAKEYYIIYFLAAVIVCPIAISFLSKDGMQRFFITSVTSILVFWLIAYLFWGYQDKPWFSTDPMPEGYYGWFSFENPLRSIWLFTAGGVSMVLGAIVKLIKTKTG